MKTLSEMNYIYEGLVKKGWEMSRVPGYLVNGKRLSSGARVGSSEERATKKEWIAFHHISHGSFSIGTDFKDFVFAYKAPHEQNCGSCMVSADPKKLFAYATGKIGIATIVSKGIVSARCILNMEEKTYSRFYGNDVIGDCLKMLGFRKQNDCLNGMSLNIVEPDPEHLEYRFRTIDSTRKSLQGTSVLVPYIDAGESGNPRASYVSLKNGKLIINSTFGSSTRESYRADTRIYFRDIEEDISDILEFSWFIAALDMIKDERSLAVIERSKQLFKEYFHQGYYLSSIDFVFAKLKKEFNINFFKFFDSSIEIEELSLNLYRAMQPKTLLQEEKVPDIDHIVSCASCSASVYSIYVDSAGY